MRLLEFEAKARLAAHGLVVPAGVLWPALPDGTNRFVVKAQVPRGGRGRSGAVVFADGRDQAEAAASRLMGQRVGEDVIAQVYVEERLLIARELYLAVAVDRDARCHVLLASPDGGMDIEAVPSGRIARIPLDPLLGLRSYTIRRVHAFLELPESVKVPFARTLRALVAAALAEDAQLVEVNPLVLTPDGNFVVADAKMMVDDNARFRHPDWGTLSLAEEGSAVDRAIAAAGATGVEVDGKGSIVGVVSGAGLMMATLDWLTASGVRVRYMIDLGGTPLADRRGLVPVFAALSQMNPAVVFVNAYFQTALADDFARALIAAHENNPIPGHVVIRLKGRNAEAARGMLTPLGFELHEDLVSGLRAALRATGHVAAS